MLCAGAVAQEFPSRQIRIGVPFPASAVARLNGEILKILNMPDVRENMRGQGPNAAPSTPEQFAALLESDGARHTKIACAANIRLD